MTLGLSYDREGAGEGSAKIIDGMKKKKKSVVVVTLIQRQNRVRGHRKGSNNSGVASGKQQNTNNTHKN